MSFYDLYPCIIGLLFLYPVPIFSLSSHFPNLVGDATLRHQFFVGYRREWLRKLRKLRKYRKN